MGGPELPRHLELPVVEVDGHDGVCTGQSGPGDRRVADAAAAEDGDRIAPTHVAGIHGCSKARHDPAANQSRHLGGSRRIDLGGLTSSDKCFLSERPDAQGRREFLAVQRHLLRGVVGGEAVPGTPPATGSTLTADGPPVQNHEVANGHLGHVGADLLDDARRLVAEEERELVVNGTLPVMEIGVANPTGLHGHEDFAGPRIGHLDGLDGDRLSLGSGHHGPDAVRHRMLPAIGMTPIGRQGLDDRRTVTGRADSPPVPQRSALLVAVGQQRHGSGEARQNQKEHHGTDCYRAGRRSDQQAQGSNEGKPRRAVHHNMLADHPEVRPNLGSTSGTDQYRRAGRRECHEGGHHGSDGSGRFALHGRGIGRRA